MQNITILSPPEPPSVPASEDRVGVAATVGSVLAAFFGVQSSRARKRDFSRGSPMLFVMVALGLTAAFALSLLTIVHFVVSQAANAG